MIIIHLYDDIRKGLMKTPSSGRECEERYLQF